MTGIYYTTMDGDMVDQICSKFYGVTGGQVVEQVYQANQGLADQGAVLPAGIEILLPEIAPAQSDQGVRLWD
jgi:phage tail protein X